METDTRSFEEILLANEKVIHTVNGISMLPMLRRRRDLVVIENKPYKLLDVVLFRRIEKNGRKSYVLHRIVKKNEDGSFLIWGDNTFTGDLVKSEDILGVMTSFVRDGKMIRCSDFLYRVYVRCYCAPYRLRVALKRKITYVKSVIVREA